MDPNENIITDEEKRKKRAGLIPDADTAVAKLKENNLLVTDPDEEAKVAFFGKDGLSRTNSTAFMPDEQPVPKGFTTEAIRGNQRTLYEYGKDGLAVPSANQPWEKENKEFRRNDLYYNALNAPADVSTSKHYDKRGNLINESTSTKNNFAEAMNAASNYLQPETQGETERFKAEKGFEGQKYASDMSLRERQLSESGANFRANLNEAGQNRRADLTAGNGNDPNYKNKVETFKALVSGGNYTPEESEALAKNMGLFGQQEQPKGGLNLSGIPEADRGAIKQSALNASKKGGEFGYNQQTGEVQAVYPDGTKEIIYSPNKKKTKGAQSMTFETDMGSALRNPKRYEQETEDIFHRLNPHIK